MFEPTSSLAAIPEPGGYFSVVKLLVLLAGLAGWLALCQWVDKDAWRLHYRRYTFNGLVVGAGLAGAIAWLLTPYFLIGLLIDAALVGTPALVYVYLRNQLVSPNSQVLTADFFARLVGRGSTAADETPLPTVQLLNMAHKPVGNVPASDPLYEGVLAGQQLLSEAIGRRAERILLTPTAQGVAVQMSIDGMVPAAAGIDRRTADLVIGYFKRSAGLDLNDRRKPQSGKLLAEEPARVIDPLILSVGYNAPSTIPARRLLLEVRTSGSRAGETAQINLSDQSSPLVLDNLGLSDRAIAQLGEFRHSANGVVLFGSGEKTGTTTTFYQAMQAHDVFMTNVQTLEERREADLENITQHQFDAESPEEASFARQLQSILRRGPDIVGISKCKDKETAQMIANAAGENVRFYVEMAGRDSVTVLARWTALVGDAALAMGPLRLVFAEALVRQLCTGCKEAYRPDPDMLRKINLPADRIDKLYRPPTQIPTDKQGNRIPCPLCQGSGYRGRTGVFEMLVVDDELRRLVIANASANEIRKYCRTQKMLYLQEEALRKVIAGTTSVNEVVRVFGGGK